MPIDWLHEEMSENDIKTVLTEGVQKFIDLEMKGIEGERSISNLTIKNLEKTIHSQETEIRELKTQLVRATEQIKEIAVSVIETQKAPKITIPSLPKVEA